METNASNVPLENSYSEPPVQNTGEQVYSNYPAVDNQQKDASQQLLESFLNPNIVLQPNQNMENQAGRVFNLDRTDLNTAIDNTYCIVENGVQRWQCRLCSRYYTSKYNLVSHVLCHMGVRPHVCNICGKAFKQGAHLSTHKLIHQGIKSHKCPVCRRMFSQVAQVKRHVVTHVNKPPYICPLCHLKCKTPLQLQTHLIEHTCGSLQEINVRRKNQDLFSVAKGAQIQCEICDRIFVYPSQLRDHMVFHSDTRTFRCTLCSMTFIKEHHLRAHHATHTDQKPHKCDECGRQFSLKGNMQRHLLIHKQEKLFECTICQKRFAQSQTLKMHAITHTKEKPYNCEVCGKSFTRGHNYRGHVAMHRNAKPYKCDCGSAFTLKGNLMRHRKEKHASSAEFRQLYPGSDNFVENLPSSSHMNISPQQNRIDNNSAFHFFKKKRKVTARKVVSVQQPPNLPNSHNVPNNRVHTSLPQVNNIPPVHLNAPNYIDAVNIDNRENTYHSLAPVRPNVNPMVSETESRYFAGIRPRLDTNAAGEIINKVHALHAAINNLATQSDNTNKVHAIHFVIDEIAGKAVQSTLHQ